jgi:ribosomal protein S18 acetylase RimI-like enzyme
MQSKQGLVGYDRFQDPTLSRNLVDCTGKHISGRLQKPASVELVEQLDSRILDYLLGIDKVFREELRYAKDYYENVLTQKSDAALILASAENESIAFAMRYHDPNPRGYTANLGRSVWFADEMAVKEPYQYRGVGPALMRLSFALGRQLGYEKIFLFCENVNDQGTNLFEYYKKLGFYPFKIQENGQRYEDEEYGIPMIVDLDDGTVQRSLEALRL